MASRKTYNATDSREKLLFIEVKEGEFAGYKQDWLVNSLNEVEIEFYVCTKCNGLMKNACQIGDEQTPVCEKCAGKDITHPMVRSRKKIPELRTKCPLEGRGCEWNGTIAEIDTHLEVCTEFIVHCSNKCDVIMKRSELINHCKNECQNREVNCQHCKLRMQYNELENHIKTCAEFPLLCPNECMKNLTRKEVVSHIEKECPNTVLNCTNNCGIQLKRSKMENHCENECQHRKVNCKHCKAIIQFKEIETHNKTCPNLVLVCSECERNIIRSEMESHIANECLETVIECPYKEMGCGEKMKRCKKEEHEKLFDTKHLAITTNYLSNKVEHIETKLEQTLEENRLLKSGKKGYEKSEIAECKQSQIRNSGGFIIKNIMLKSENEKLQSKVIALEKKLIEMDYNLEVLSEKISYPVVLREELTKDFTKFMDVKSLLNTIFFTPIFNYNFCWNKQKFQLTFQYGNKQPVILVSIQMPFNKETAVAIKWPLRIQFKLTFVDRENSRNCLVFESQVWEIKNIVATKEKERENQNKNAMNLPRDIMHEKRFRNEDRSISFMLQMKEVNDFPM